MASRSPSASPWWRQAAAERHQQDEIPGRGGARRAEQCKRSRRIAPRQRMESEAEKRLRVLRLAPADLQPQFFRFIIPARTCELARGLHELFDGHGHRRKPSRMADGVQHAKKNGGPKPAV